MPEGFDFQLATSGDINLAIDKSVLKPRGADNSNWDASQTHHAVAMGQPSRWDSDHHFPPRWDCWGLPARNKFARCRHHLCDALRCGALRPANWNISDDQTPHATNRYKLPHMNPSMRVAWDFSEHCVRRPFGKMCFLTLTGSLEMFTREFQHCKSPDRSHRAERSFSLD